MGVESFVIFGSVGVGLVLVVVTPHITDVVFWFSFPEMHALNTLRIVSA